MSDDAWVTAGVVVATLVLLAVDRYPATGVVLAAAVGLLVLDVVDAGGAFGGFSNPAPITVAALYILARGAQKTGLLTPLTTGLLGRTTGRGALTRLLLPAAAGSAFLNNTPLVAILIPDVVSWAEHRRVSASRYLLPLSYAAIFGGMVTLLGTSTNLVISGLLVQAGEEPFGLFEITKIGGPVAIVGLVVLIFGASRLLPARLSALERAESEARGFVVAMQVEPDGPLSGLTVAGAGLRDLQGVFLAELERDGEVIVPVTPETRLAGGDRLTFVGRSDQIVDLQRMRGLRSREEEHLLAVDSFRHTFFEAVVGRSSPLLGLTLKEAEFRSRYGAAVVAIHRAGHRVEAKLGSVRLQNGDTLLVLAGPRFAERFRDRRDFLVIARIGGPPPSATRKAPVVGAIWAGVILLAAFEVLPILEGALLGSAALLVTRVLTFAEAREAVDIDVIVLIAAAFGIGAAMDQSGLAAEVANQFVTHLEGFGQAGIILGVVLATSILTELITNNAAAVVVFPIAFSIAGPAGIDPRTLAVAVAVAASASFLTPIGYQTNTMVYGPGGYRFTDYLRVGAPLTVTALATITVVTTLVA